MPAIHDSIGDLPAGFTLSGLPRRPPPTGVLMCPPTWFQVVDEKNPHMAGHAGQVRPETALAQWRAVQDRFAAAGMQVHELPPTADCEDMVFCANQTFVGPGPDGRPVGIASRMRHASRQREVPAFERWFAARGCPLATLPAGLGFEGGGDAIWHPGRALIWGGYGHRSDATAYEHVAARCAAPVLRLRLLSDRFYHLDTCLSALDERTALVHAAAFEPRGLDLLRRVFERVIEAPPEEANEGLACNACALPGGHVVIQAGNNRTCAALRAAGYQLHEVDTTEFLKSGGSVYCMKSYVWT